MDKHQHFAIYKPYGYLSQFINNQSKRKNKKLLGELGNFPIGTMAIGRLDQKSEGLLLLTTNGKVSNEITSTKYEKEYYVQVNGLITTEALSRLKNSVTINVHGKYYQTKPCKVTLLLEEPPFEERSKKIRDARHGPTSWISITLTEGKFRQIRKMTSKVGFPTLRLVRIRIGNYYLNNMKIGEVKSIDL
jgi:23S rRNA pseudouridine2457 synthase